ncbi:MAG: PIN domain-containing protein, partial [Gemmatimonadaceae bacterium]
LIWWASDERRRFGRRARKFFEAVDAGRAVMCVPTTALVELSEAVHRGTASMSVSFDAFTATLERTPSRYQVIPLTAAIVARSHTLFAIPECGDRLIGTTAAELGYPIITRDPAIVDVVGLDHVW